MDPRRAQRISEALREELAEIVEYELADPRLAGASITEALLTPDGRHARISVLVRGGEREQREALEALDHARHYLRRELSGRLRLFRVPDLLFEPDTSAGAAGRVEELLKRVRKNREKST
jgi:ribosome-binding factor A